MPVYEYLCVKCSERFSLLRSINADDKDLCCPKCSAGDVKKLVSSFCCGTDSAGGFGSAPAGGFSGGG